MSGLKYYRNLGVQIVASALTVAVLSADIKAQEDCSSFGWANFDGQTEIGPVTGGGNVTPDQVTTFAALKSAIESSDAKVIHVMNDVGNGYKGTSGDVLNPKSNKTVIGAKPGITVKCSWQINNASNLIVKNLICMGPGNSNSEQNWDVVNIQGSSKRIWFDHCTIMEGEDGNFDFVKGADNLTVTWCKFTYVTGGEHNLSNLIGSSDNETQSHGKLNATYAWCWWENVNSRCPRARYGKIHLLNCYYNKVGSGAYAGFMSNLRVEGCYFESNVSNPTGLISTGGQAGVFAIDCNVSGNKMDGYTEAFAPPYQYKKYANSEVKSLVTGNAGATLTNPTVCDNTVSVRSPGMTEKRYVNELTGDNVIYNICVGSTKNPGFKKQLSFTDATTAKVTWMDLRGKVILKETQFLDNNNLNIVAPSYIRGFYLVKVEAKGASPVVVHRMIQ